MFCAVHYMRTLPQILTFAIFFGGGGSDPSVLKFNKIGYTVIHFMHMHIHIPIYVFMPSLVTIGEEEVKTMHHIVASYSGQYYLQYVGSLDLFNASRWSHRSDFTQPPSICHVLSLSIQLTRRYI